jgi:hypothetical protein
LTHQGVARGDDEGAVRVNMAPRRLAAIGLAVLLIVGVGIGITMSVAQNVGNASVVSLNGVIGSEKQPFFADAKVQAALKRGGFEVTVSTAGSRQIASMDLSKDDFAFPAGAPAGQKIKADHSGSTVYQPFYTPMAIATWKPIVGLLLKAGIAQQRNGYVALDMNAFMKAVASDTRWKDLPGNTDYPVNKSILITSTDPRTSNSAAMYLSLASYVVNGNAIVSSDSQVSSVMPIVSPLFLRQGFVENSSEVPFDDYLVQGMGHSPMVMIYESQYVARAAAEDGSITANMQLIYPEPTIFSKHTFVALNANADRLGQFISNDPEMRTLATQYGFRTSDTAGFASFVSQHKVSVPDSFIDVIEPPTYETLEAMIGRLEQLYSNATPS